MLNASSKPSSNSDKPAEQLQWGIPVALTVMLISFIALPVIAQIVLSLIPSVLGWDTSRAQQWLDNAPLASFLYVVLAEALTMGGLLAFLRHKKTSLRTAVALKKVAWRDLGYTLIGIVVYFILFASLLAIINSVTPVDTTKEQAIGFEKDLAGGGLILAFVSLVVLPPIVEEVLFRGFLFGTLRRRKVKMVLATFITSLLFAGLHLFGATDGSLLWLAFIDTFVLSLVLCYVREATGSLWASIGVHALKNGLVFVNLFIIGGL